MLPQKIHEAIEWMKQKAPKKGRGYRVEDEDHILILIPKGKNEEREPKKATRWEFTED